MKYIIYNQVMNMNLSPSAKVIYSTMVYHSLTKSNGIGDFIDSDGEMTSDNIDDLISMSNNWILADEDILNNCLSISKKDAVKVIKELVSMNLISRSEDQLYINVASDFATLGYFAYISIESLSIGSNLMYSFLLDRTKITQYRWVSGRERLALLTKNSLANTNKHLTVLRNVGLVTNNKYYGYIQINH